MAIGVLDVYDKNTRENVADVLVMRYMKEFSMDCLEMAVHCQCKRFVSNVTVQRILDNIWTGKRNEPLEIVIICLTLRGKNYFLPTKKLSNFKIKN